MLIIILVILYVIFAEVSIIRLTVDVIMSIPIIKMIHKINMSSQINSIIKNTGTKNGLELITSMSKQNRLIIPNADKLQLIQYHWAVHT
jgi:hypothetical protein